jgi:hypothetical protein
MVLHRDIFWVGRQWAVTGFGIQAVDPRLKGAFDIEVSRLWEEALIERTRELPWLNHDDFKKALELARSRFPEPPKKTLPLVESVLELIQPKSVEAAKPKPQSAKADIKPRQPATRKPPADAPRAFVLRLGRASAKFLPQWRVRR